MGLLRFGALQFFVFPDCLRHLREVANQKRRSTATLASAPHVTRVHFWKKCRAPINIPIATKLRRLEVPFLESRTVGIFQSTDSHFGHRAISRYFFAFRRALRRRKPSKRMRLSGRDRTSSRRRGGFSGMGVTTRGGARACVVDTGSTATRANAPPARGAAHTGAEREARGVVRDKQRRGLEVAEGPGATGATALLRDRGAKRSADAAPLGAEAASNARRRAGEAVTDVTSLPVRTHPSRNEPTISRLSLFFFSRPLARRSLSPPPRDYLSPESLD